MSDVEIQDSTVAQDPVIETPVETEVQTQAQEETPVETKSTKDLLDEVVAKVKGGGKETKVEEQITETPGQPQYVPNYKFNANKKEHEIPEVLRSAITNKETEKQVRELCEKAFGLDPVKAERETVYQELGKSKQAHQELLGGINDLRTMYARKDLDGFFKKLNIPEEAIMQYALDKAQYLNLTPEQRAGIDARKNAERQAYSLETQNNGLSKQNADIATRMRSMELEFTFNRPDVSSLAKEVDSRFGKSGALRQLVIDAGYNTWVQSGGRVDLTPEQALQAVMEKFGIKPGSTQAPAATQTQALQVAPEATQAARKPAPVIPNIQGRSTSPVKSNKPRSIEDIRKLSAAMN